MTKSKLYVIPTPIGNLGDITYRSIETLKTVTIILAEDTRRTLQLLEHYGLKGKELIPFHEHNETTKIHWALDNLRRESIAIVSDAGTPAIADPGFKLISACRDAGITVEVLPGACAAVTAIVGSGLPTNEFVFLGFLPRTDKKKEKVFLQWKEYEGTLIFYETPHRILFSLRIMQHAYENQGEIVIARELTKIHEEYLRGTFDQIIEHFEKNPPRGEMIILRNKKQRSNKKKFSQSLS